MNEQVKHRTKRLLFKVQIKVTFVPCLYAFFASRSLQFSALMMKNTKLFFFNLRTVVPFSMRKSPFMDSTNFLVE